MIDTNQFICFYLLDLNHFVIMKLNGKICDFFHCSKLKNYFKKLGKFTQKTRIVFVFTLKKALFLNISAELFSPVQND